MLINKSAFSVILSYHYVLFSALSLALAPDASSDKKRPIIFFQGEHFNKCAAVGTVSGLHHVFWKYIVAFEGSQPLWNFQSLLWGGEGRVHCMDVFGNCALYNLVL